MKLTNLSIATKVYWIVGLIFFFNLTIMAFLWNHSKATSQTYDQLFVTKVKSQDIARVVQVTFKKQVQEWKNILLRGHDPEDFKKYTDAFLKEDEAVSKGAKELLETVKDSPEVKKEVESFLSAHEKMGGQYRGALQHFVKSGGKDAHGTDALVKGQDRAATDSVDRIVELLNESVTKEIAAYQQAQKSAERSLGLAILAVLACSFPVVVFVVRRGIQRPLEKTETVLACVAKGDLTHRLNIESQDEVGRMAQGLNTALDSISNTLTSMERHAQSLATATEELSAAAGQQAQGAEVQKDQSTQVASAMQEMSSTILQVAESSNKASQEARTASETARKGGRIVEQTLTKMRDIATSVSQTASRVQELGKSSDQIGEIVGVINDIADQTNLLALNAAIEAARAGDQGRGFAVVADEVRKLAERTTTATKEIAQMIKGVQSETRLAVEAMHSGTRQVQDGVETTAEAGQALQEIINMADRVGDVITHIAAAVNQQSVASEQVNRSVDQIARISQESASGAGQSAKACHDLAVLALDLRTLVSQFRLEETGQAGVGSSRPRGTNPLWSERPAASV